MNAKTRLDRVEGVLSPAWTLAGVCRVAAERAGLDPGWVVSEARHILAAAADPAEAVRLAVAELAEASGRSADEVRAEIEQAAAELAA